MCDRPLWHSIVYNNKYMFILHHYSCHQGTTFLDQRLDFLYLQRSTLRVVWRMATLFASNSSASEIFLSTRFWVSRHCRHLLPASFSSSNALPSLPSMSRIMLSCFFSPDNSRSLSVPWWAPTSSIGTAADVDDDKVEDGKNEDDEDDETTEDEGDVVFSWLIWTTSLFRTPPIKSRASATKSCVPSLIFAMSCVCMDGCLVYIRSWYMSDW